MLNNLLKKIFGDKSAKDQKELLPYVDKINSEYTKLQSISSDELRAMTVELKKEIAAYVEEDEKEIKALEEKANGDDVDVLTKESIYQEIDEKIKKVDEKREEVLMEVLPKAFAVVKETSRRFAQDGKIEVTATEHDRNYAEKKSNVEIQGDKAIWYNKWDAAGTEVEWNMVHYDVQLIGGVVLHQGKIAEMQTGEGKTLVATLPVYLNALAGKGVHVVTVNDYLAKRDSEWMGPLYEFHGMRVDCIDKYRPNSPERLNAYQADIAFGTNNEFGFDYLRDNMAKDVESLVQKKHHFAIIDEVDSVLIDDARTPLIISGPTPQGDKHEYAALKPEIEKLVNAQKKATQKFLTDAKALLAASETTEDKKEAARQAKEGGIALLRAFRGMPKNKALIKFLSEPGMRAVLQKTENFYLQDQEKEMPFIDQELYFTIEEKSNSIELKEKGIDLISGGQNKDFYIMPDMGAELAAIENAGLSKDDELKQKDQLIQDFTQKAERIHSMNQLLKAYCMYEKEVEYIIDEGKVKIVDEQTGRIMDGRRYSDGLHQAIEAKENVTVEAATQTYATITLQNYFRMYHKLAGMTGTAETEAKELYDIYELDVVIIPTNRPIARKDMNDLVFKTAREKYNAIIDEVEKIRNEGRPVLVGTTTVEISELLSRMMKMRKIQHQVLNAKQHQREAEVVAEAGKPGMVTIATNMAGRGTDIKLGEGVKEAGGLAIIGTERHDSRRVDRQLRGRAGRQGDPGSSQFFVSLEDNLMRLFGSERIAKMMDRLGFKEGEVIEHSMITKSIERAQKKVEENNFGIRKRLLEYDDVMNSQRNAIYKRRKNALYGDRLAVDLANVLYDVCSGIVDEYQELQDYEGFELEVLRVLAVEPPVDNVDQFVEADPNELTEQLYQLAKEKFDRKNKDIQDAVTPVMTKIKAEVESQGIDQRPMIGVPFNDGRRGLQVPVDVLKAVDDGGQTVVRAMQKGISLGVIDQEWKEHLREMDDLRQSVRNAQYEQKDPVLIYKLESFKLFQTMMLTVNKDIVSFLVKANVPQPENGEVDVQVAAPRQEQQENTQATRTEVPQFAGGASTANQAPPTGQAQKAAPVVRETPKIGRNDKVTIFNIVTGEKKEVKFKQAEPLVQSGQWRLME